MRILIVEDDVALGALLQRGMRSEGNEVHLVTDGEAAVNAALQERPDLIVLDLGLPRKDGVEVLRDLDGRIRGTSILVLSGRSSVQERIQCLNLGADDCMLKPFSLQELSARCKALTRRREQFADPVLHHGDVELNRLDRKVTRSGRRVDLTVKEFALLEYLMHAGSRICTRSELLREVWQMSPDAGTNVVDVYVNYLRRKLGAVSPEVSNEDVPLIETVRGSGYRMGACAQRDTAGAFSYLSEPLLASNHTEHLERKPWQNSSFLSSNTSNVSRVG